MKKVIYSFIVFLLMILNIGVVSAEENVEKVPVYIFTKNGCSACQAAFQYFDELEKSNPDLFQQYIIEVFDGNWQITDQKLNDLLIASLKRKDGDTEKLATPTIFIGDYFTVGLPNDETEVYNAIVAAKDKAYSEEKVDIVKEEAEKLDIDLQQFMKVPEKMDLVEAIIIISVFVLLVGGFVGIILVSKKK